MNFTEAIEIIQQYREDWGYPGLLETLEGMSSEHEKDNLNMKQSRALRVALREFSKLFAPAR